jgi:hypothetical protein
VTVKKDIYILAQTPQDVETVYEKNNENARQLLREKFQAIKKGVLPDQESPESKVLLSSSRHRLAKFIAKKLTTTFVGDLSDFEQLLGDVRDNPAWQEVRYKVLERGNKHIRDIQRELEKYFIEELGS